MVALIWPTCAITVQKSIVPCSMRFKIRSLDRLRSKTRSRKWTQTRLCALIFLRLAGSGCSKNRRSGEKQADLVPDAPMLCSDAAPADKDADVDADTEMTLCLRQCYRRPRRLARCNQAPRRRSRWRRSCHHCPRHRRRRHHRHCPPQQPPGDVPRDAPGLGAAAPAAPPGEVQAAALQFRRCHRPFAVAEAASNAPRLPLQGPSLRRRRRRRRRGAAAGAPARCLQLPS